jgi:hypothetical protein
MEHAPLQPGTTRKYSCWLTENQARPGNNREAVARESARRAIGVVTEENPPQAVVDVSQADRRVCPWL